MDTRLNFYGNTLGARISQQIHAAAAVVVGSTLPHTTQELVRIRASQLNGSSFCTDIHFKDSLHNSETLLRLTLIAAWREASVFTDAERAALELAEHGTRLGISTGGVSDDVWATARRHYDEDQLAALVSQIALINTFNRTNVITRQRAGNEDLVAVHERENPAAQPN